MSATPMLFCVRPLHYGSFELFLNKCIITYNIKSMIVRSFYCGKIDRDFTSFKQTKFFIVPLLFTDS